jgi:hypothetical protein
VDALTDPQSLPSFGVGAQQAFHVVAPSIPGFGFSDASPAEEFGLKETAEAFDAVMLRLGYGRYVAHGVGWYATQTHSSSLRVPNTQQGFQYLSSFSFEPLTALRRCPHGQSIVRRADMEAESGGFFKVSDRKIYTRQDIVSELWIHTYRARRTSRIWIRRWNDYTQLTVFSRSASSSGFKTLFPSSANTRILAV